MLLAADLTTRADRSARCNAAPAQNCGAHRVYALRNGIASAVTAYEGIAR